MRVERGEHNAGGDLGEKTEVKGIPWLSLADPGQSLSVA